MPAPCDFQVGDAVALPVGGELRLVEVVTIVEGRLVCVDASDRRRRVLHLTAEEASRRGEHTRAARCPTNRDDVPRERLEKGAERARC